MMVWNALKSPAQHPWPGSFIGAGHLATLAAWAAMGGLLMGVAPGARAISCTTQSQMTLADRADLAAAATRLAGYALSGDEAALKAATLPSVAAQFDGIASSVDTLAPLARGAHVEIEDLYQLSAQDLKPSDDEAQFFCSVPGSPMLVTIAISGLPAGNYALAIVHAEGVARPQQIGMILARAGSAGPGAGGAGNAGTGWQLAGFFARPLTIAGHDGVWYWTRARELAKARDRWSAYFYYQSARYLLTPVDFIASPNLAKLDREAAAVKPEGLPGEGTPTLAVTAGDLTYSVTAIRTDASLGELDLALTYNASGMSTGDPVASRAQAVTLMQAMLKDHPELRANFHGLWVYATASGRAPFAVELPMDQIQ